MADLDPTEALAAQLFATFEMESGDILRGTEWMADMDLHAVAAWKWVRLAPRLKDAWLAIAVKSQQHVKSSSKA